MPSLLASNALSDGKTTLTLAPQAPPYYAGSTLALKCYYGYTAQERSVTVQFIWTGVKGTRWSVVPLSDETGDSSTLMASTLSVTDGGVVTCTMWVTPHTPSPYIAAGNTTMNTSFSVVGKRVGVVALCV